MKSTYIGRQILLGCTWVIVILFFHFCGVTVFEEVVGKSLFAWIVNAWKASGGTAVDYSIGYLIPLVSAYIIWQRRKTIGDAKKQADNRGLGLMIGALALHWIGLRTQLAQLSVFSLILLLWAIPFYIYGAGVARATFFPACYLLFCIPLNFIESLSFPLRIVGASASNALLNGLGFATVRSGTALFASSGGGFSIDVADACSGIKSLMALTSLSAAYAYITQRTLAKKWIVFLAAIPFAVIGNIVRILSIALAINFLGKEMGMRFYHDLSGYLVFIVVTLLLIKLDGLLNSQSPSAIDRPSELNGWKA